MNGEILEQVKIYKYLEEAITKNWGSVREIKYRIGMTKEAFMKKRALLSGKVELD